MSIFRFMGASCVLAVRGLQARSSAMSWQISARSLLGCLRSAPGLMGKFWYMPLKCQCRHSDSLVLFTDKIWCNKPVRFCHLPKSCRCPTNWYFSASGVPTPCQWPGKVVRHYFPNSVAPQPGFIWSHSFFLLESFGLKPSPVLYPLHQFDTFFVQFVASDWTLFWSTPGFGMIIRSVENSSCQFWILIHSPV